MGTWTTPSAIHSKCGEYALHPAIDTIDDDTASYWRHNATCYHWIIFDCSQTYSFSKIKIYQGTLSTAHFGKADGLDVFVSDDPTNWGSAVWTGVLNASGWQQSGSFNKDGRYVKLVSKNDDTAQRLYEFVAYYSSGFVPFPNLSSRDGGIHSILSGGIGR